MCNAIQQSKSTVDATAGKQPEAESSAVGSPAPCVCLFGCVCLFPVCVCVCFVLSKFKLLFVCAMQYNSQHQKPLKKNV